MARKLPWARQGASGQIRQRPRPPRSAHRRSFSPSASSRLGRRKDDNDDDDDNSGDSHNEGNTRRAPKIAKSSSSKGSAHASQNQQTVRTPSTSPPPAPPPESFMVDGMDHDDRYRMVEDELLAVAQTFTAHLHAAAYQRLKRRAQQAKGPVAAASRSLARPTVTTGVSAAARDRVARRTAAAKQRAKKAAAVRAVGLVHDAGDGDDNHEDDKDNTPWAGTALHDLMESDPRKGRPSLVSLASVAGNRPSAVVLGSRVGGGEVDDDDDDDDDLDGPPVKQKTTARPLTSSPYVPPRSPRHPVATTPGQNRIAAARDGPPDKRSVSFAPDVQARDVQARHETEGDDEDEEDDDPADLDDAGDLMQTLRKRRAQEKAHRLHERKRRREHRRDEQDKGPLDTIPSFL
ncbi:hypothetical protein SPBR_02913 [Sporothrix brasiliensis 5110]|uniref:Uncharacterized protein n=1 Tax=Sporothrix brasiliensis 5110 TaxID=1398154 RepID=A0A0C2FQ63_9PEZI|nr:uncharacterized protein SPBR_02913 [Sporothrix brasiliensis 5110]KIH93148.1 hypothetical protein SPBR_02913 [Sporothrix brasiliensis 5110]